MIALMLVMLSAGPYNAQEEFARFVTEKNPELVIERKNDQAWLFHDRAHPERSAKFQMTELREMLRHNDDTPAQRELVYMQMTSRIIGRIPTPLDTSEILPQLVPDSFLSNKEVKTWDLISTPYGDSFALIFAAGVPDALTYLRKNEHPELLPPTKVKTLALKNLDRVLKARLQRELDGTLRANPAETLLWQDDHSACALLLLPGLLKPGEVIFAVQADETTLHLLPPPRDGKLDAYLGLATKVTGMQSRVSPTTIVGLLRVTNSGVTRVK